MCMPFPATANGAKCGHGMGQGRKRKIDEGWIGIARESSFRCEERGTIPNNQFAQLWGYVR